MSLAHDARRVWTRASMLWVICLRWAFLPYGISPVEGPTSSKQFSRMGLGRNANRLIYCMVFCVVKIPGLFLTTFQLTYKSITKSINPFIRIRLTAFMNAFTIRILSHL